MSGRVSWSGESFIFPAPPVAVTFPPEDVSPNPDEDSNGDKNETRRRDDPQANDNRVRKTYHSADNGAETSQCNQNSAKTYRVSRGLHTGRMQWWQLP
jgi:hypothetical protein